jgi:hypothetical protein
MRQNQGDGRAHRVLRTAGTWPSLLSGGGGHNGRPPVQEQASPVHKRDVRAAPGRGVERLTFFLEGGTETGGRDTALKPRVG